MTAEILELTSPDEEDDGIAEPCGSAQQRARDALKRDASRPYSEELRRQTQARVRAMYARRERQGELL